MKRSLLVVNAIWALLAVGAYMAGTWHSRSDENSRPQQGAAMSRLPARTTPLGGSVAGASVKPGAGPAAIETEGWLQSWRGSDGAISPERMKEAVQAALRDSDPVRATLRFTHLLHELTPENALAALQSINENAGGSDGMRYLNLLAHAWGAKDAPAALAALESLRRRDLDGTKTTVMAAWAANDPDAALRWIQELKAKSGAASDERQEWVLSRGVVTGLARRDADAALNYVMTLDKDAQADFAGLLVEQKMKEGVPGAAEWALKLPEERMRTNALETVGYQFIRQDLPAAVQWAEQIAARPDAHEAVADVGNELANRNGAEAAAWAAKLPAGPSQNHALEDIFENWTRSDPLGASKSLDHMNPGPARDSAIQAFSRTLARENPADAITWAGEMSNPKERLDVQVEIARRWQSTAPADARAWIAANLPPDAQARALAPGRR
jgi:hypothetical protein